MPFHTRRQLRRSHARLGRVNGFFFQRGPLIALAFVVSSIPAIAVDAKRLAAWLVLPAVMSVVGMFVTFGLYCMTGSLVILSCRRRSAGRVIEALCSFALGVFFAWAGGSGLYAFLSQAPLGRG